MKVAILTFLIYQQRRLHQVCALRLHRPGGHQQRVALRGRRRGQVMENFAQVPIDSSIHSHCPPQLVRRGAAGAVVRGGRVRAADPAHGGAAPQRGRGGVGAGGGQGGAGAAPAALGGGQHRHPQGQVK